MAYNVPIGYLSLLKNLSVSKDFETGDDTNQETKTDQSNFTDDSNNDFIGEFLSIKNRNIPFEISSDSKKCCFQYSQSTFPKVNYEIQSPPPEV